LLAACSCSCLPPLFWLRLVCSGVRACVTAVGCCCARHPPSPPTHPRALPVQEVLSADPTLLQSCCTDSSSSPFLQLVVVLAAKSGVRPSEVDMLIRW
jgi:hypothetical protein